MDVSAPHAAPLTASPFDGPLARTTGAVDPKSIPGIAKGFESMFLSMLLKEMRGTLDQGTLFGDDKSDILGGLFDQFLGDHLSRSNSLGIATMVRKQLERASPTHDSSNRHRAAYAPGT